MLTDESAVKQHSGAEVSTVASHRVRCSHLSVRTDVSTVIDCTLLDRSKQQQQDARLHELPALLLADICLICSSHHLVTTGKPTDVIKNSYLMVPPGNVSVSKPIYKIWRVNKNRIHSLYMLFLCQCGFTLCIAVSSHSPTGYSELFIDLNGCLTV